MKPSSSTERLKLAISIVIVVGLLVAVPIAYSELVDELTNRPAPRFVDTWSDPGFAGNWTVRPQHSSVNMTRADGILTLNSSTSLPANFLASAQLPNLPPIDVVIDPYLTLAVRTSNIDVAIRLAIGTTNNTSSLVMLTTFNDDNWHNTTIDLRYFGFTGVWSFPFIELGFEVVQTPSVSYASVSFAALAVGKIVYG